MTGYEQPCYYVGNYELALGGAVFASTAEGAPRAARAVSCGHTEQTQSTPFRLFHIGELVSSTSVTSARTRLQNPGSARHVVESFRSPTVVRPSPSPHMAQAQSTPDSVSRSHAMSTNMLALTDARGRHRTA